MNKTVSIIGLLIIVGVWAAVLTIPFREDVETILGLCGIVLGLGLAYSLLHQKDYPVQAILVVLVVEFVLKILLGQSVERVLFHGFLAQVNLYLGTIFATFSPLVDRVFSVILSPIQRFFSNIGLKTSIPVIAGILLFFVGYFLISSGVAYG